MLYPPDAGQLTSADYSSSQTDESYAFDATGNRTGGSYATPGANNRLLDDGTFEYTYDNEGNRLTRVGKSSDPADDHRTEYSWDHRNRLTQVTFKNNSGTVTKVVAYSYDVFDRRIARKLDTTNPCTLADAAIERYVYDGDDVVLEWLDLNGGGPPSAHPGQTLLTRPRGRPDPSPGRPQQKPAGDEH